MEAVSERLENIHTSEIGILDRLESYQCVGIFLFECYFDVCVVRSGACVLFHFQYPDCFLAPGFDPSVPSPFFLSRF